MKAAAVFLLDHFDATLVLPALSFVVILAALRLIYGGFYPVFSLVVSLTLAPAALYIFIFSTFRGDILSFGEKMTEVMFYIATFTPQVSILLITFVWALSRFIRSKPTATWAAVFAAAVVGIGHLWTRSVLIALSL